MKEYLEEATQIIIVQVDGKFRDKLEVEKGLDKASSASLALDRPNVKIYTQDKEIKNVVWVEGKLLNFVLN